MSFHQYTAKGERFILVFIPAVDDTKWCLKRNREGIVMTCSLVFMAFFKGIFANELFSTNWTACPLLIQVANIKCKNRNIKLIDLFIKNVIYFLATISKLMLFWQLLISVQN